MDKEEKKNYGLLTNCKDYDVLCKSRQSACVHRLSVIKPSIIARLRAKVALHLGYISHAER